MTKQYYIYIATNYAHTLYIGVTNNLERRMLEHASHVPESFTDTYNIDALVYYEETSNVNDAIAREKQLKGWRRSKKIALIESVNPDWRDLLKRPFDCAQGDSKNMVKEAAI